VDVEYFGRKLTVPMAAGLGVAAVTEDESGNNPGFAVRDADAALLIAML
jgi:hypothetical protein